MFKVKDNNTELEILIATMHRSSLDFLSKMFSGLNYVNYNILVVNQTTKGNELSSPHLSVKVINSYDRGLSKSRNLAIKHATKSICLLTDDDVVFKKDFNELILNAHENNSYSIITFQTQTTHGKLYWDYPLVATKHTNFISRKTLSTEISFKKEQLKELRFNEKFGLGAIYEDGENYVFLSDAKKIGICVYFENTTISIHEPFSSSDEVLSDRLLYAKSALHFHRYGNLAYFWVFKFVFFLIRKNYISLSETLHKIKIGFKGVNDYRKDK